MDERPEEKPMMSRRNLFLLLCVTYLAQSFYLYTEGTAVETSHPLSAQVQAGWELFQDNNCSACHQFYGLGGYMGPDLTNIISDPNKGPEYAAAFIQFGTDKMPDFGFSDAEVAHIVSFLDYADSSGRYPPVGAEMLWTGWVDYKENEQGSGNE